MEEFMSSKIGVFAALLFTMGIIAGSLMFDHWRNKKIVNSLCKKLGLENKTLSYGRNNGQIFADGCYREHNVSVFQGSETIKHRRKNGAPWIEKIVYTFIKVNFKTPLELSLKLTPKKWHTSFMKTPLELNDEKIQKYLLVDKSREEIVITGDSEFDDSFSSISYDSQLATHYLRDVKLKKELLDYIFTPGMFGNAKDKSFMKLVIEDGTLILARRDDIISADEYVKHVDDVIDLTETIEMIS